MHSPILLLTTLFLTLTLLTHPAASTGQIKKFNSYEYQLFEEPVSWQDAQQRCSVWGGDLCSIANAQENDFVKSFTSQTFWIGYHNLQGTWQWVSNAPRTYENWFDAEPNNWNNNEHCVEVNHHAPGTWNDLNCDTKQFYLCKRRENTCHWNEDDTVIGAPRPVVSTEFLGQDIIIRVQMAKRGRNSPRDVLHVLSFGEDFAGVDVKTCNVRTTYQLCDRQIWRVEEDRCETVYTMRMSLSEYIARTKPKIEFVSGSDLVRITNNLEMIYLDADEMRENKPLCNVARFSTEISSQTILLPDSHVDFEFESDSEIVAPTQYTAVSLNTAGKLVVEAILKPSSAEYAFGNFKFHRHSNGVEFFLHWTPFDCNDEGEQCSYGVSLISRDALQDYSGNLIIEFDVYQLSSGLVTKTAFTLNLQYSLVEQPSILNNVVGTKSVLTNRDFVSEETTITPFSRAFVLTRTTDRLYEPAELGIKYAFLCCSRDRVPLAPFDPSAGQYGCTRKVPSTMSVWRQLVDNGTPLELDTQIESLGPLINDKTAFSFDPSTLFGEDKLCYIHVTSSLKVRENRRRGTLEKQHPLESMFPISFKSCSYFADEKSCKDAAVCQWESKIGVCSNIKGVEIEEFYSNSVAAKRAGLAQGGAVGVAGGSGSWVMMMICLIGTMCGLMLVM